jgi:hypothetical protein
LAAVLVNKPINAIEVMPNIIIPIYTGEFSKIERAKQNNKQHKRLTIKAMILENLELPLSIETRFNKPAKIIAKPDPMNHNVASFIIIGKAKQI